MKRLLIIIAVALAGYGAFCQDETVNIPDKNFKKYLLANKAINTTADDKITVAEAAAFGGKIDVGSPSIGEITSLEGIEAFVNITGLNCFVKSLTTLNVSKNTNLTELDCSGNQLTTLNVSGATALTSLRCSGNKLTTLNVSKNTKLTDLDCSINRLTTLNVSGATALIGLSCLSNQLTTLDVSKNTELTDLACFYNRLTTLNVSKNTELTELHCNKNRLTTLNLRNGQNSKLASFTISGNPALACVQVDDASVFRRRWQAAFTTAGINTNIISETCAQVTRITVKSVGNVATRDIKEGNLRMTVEVLPTYATNRNVRWSVDDTAIATIDAITGVLTPKSTGTVTITATAEDAGGVTGTKQITITDAIDASSVKQVKSITVKSEGDVATIDILATLQMRADVEPSDATNRNVRWSVDDESVATIDAITGVLTAKSTGTVRVTATAEDAGRVTGTKVITITKQVKSITVKNEERTLSEERILPIRGAFDRPTEIQIPLSKGTLQMTADVLPADATDNTVRWSVNKPAIATIDPTTGVLTLKSKGTVTVTATAEDTGRVTGTEEITITKQVKSIAVKSAGDVATRDIKEGNLRMTSEVLPADATNQNVSWSVDDTAIATIDAITGVLTPKSTGTVTITATAEDAGGVTGTKQITITDAIDASSVKQVKSITVKSEGDVATIYILAILPMTADVLPTDATNQNVRWSVDNESVATIHEITGVLISEDAGTVTVTATAEDAGGVKGTKEITITDAIDPSSVRQITRITVRSAGDVATIDIREGTLQMRAEVLPTDATNKNPQWSVDDESKATIDAITGVLTPKSKGTVTVTATAEDAGGVKGTKEITITDAIDPSSVRQITRITVKSVGDVTTTDILAILPMTADVLPADATNTNVRWSVDNESVATIDEDTGVLTPKSKGTVRVTATAQDGSRVTGTKQITITDAIDPSLVKQITDITVRSVGNVATRDIKEGTLQMTAEVLPAEATNKDVDWSVDDESKATIDEDTGVLTPKSTGAVTITATAKDGSEVKGTKQITITDNPAPVVTGIAEDAAGEQLMIYPNPAGDIVIIKATDRIVESVTIQDLTGTIVKVIEKDTHSVNVSSLRSGTYLVKVKTATGTIFSKFVKMNP